MHFEHKILIFDAKGGLGRCAHDENEEGKSCQLEKRKKREKGEEGVAGACVEEGSEKCVEEVGCCFQPACVCV